MDVDEKGAPLPEQLAAPLDPDCVTRDEFNGSQVNLTILSPDGRPSAVSACKKTTP